jgi:hypothetical protein
MCLVALFSVALAASAGVNVWTSGGPTAGYAYSVAVDPLTPATVYATAYPGVFKSEDGGLTWFPSGLESAYRACDEYFPGPYWPIAIDPVLPTTLYVGTNIGVYKSFDAGATWTSLNTALAWRQVRAIAIDPLSHVTLLRLGSSLPLLRGVFQERRWR